jgi:ribulose-phosphate 3-epimerase
MTLIPQDASATILLPQEENQRSFQILPSILSSDFTRLGEQVKALEAGGCQVLHLDVMDGHFVPNLTIGPPLVKALSKATQLIFDVHLMVTHPDHWTEAFDVPNTRCITIHAEAGYHLHRSLQKIRDCGKLAGLALNPATPLEVLEYLWPTVDLVLIMTVNPGFGGQSFIEPCRQKIRTLRKMIEAHTDGHVILEIDGGVHEENLADLAAAGAQWVVTGNALFSPGQLARDFRRFQKIGTAAWKALPQ